MTARHTPSPLDALFAGRGLVHKEPDVLQPAEVFLDLSGEDIRRRLLLVQSPDGTDTCLRPDYTIPLALAHIEAREKQGGYWYQGPVFRYRSEDGAVQIEQAGVESYGNDDHAAADAETLLLAIEALKQLGVQDTTIRMGDPGLMMAAIEAIGLPGAWQKRLRRGFGRPGGIGSALETATSTKSEGTRGRLVATLAGADHATATAMVEDLVGLAGIAAVGGRSAGEIAERLMEQAELESSGGLTDASRAVLRQLAEIEGPPQQALDQFAAVAKDAGIDISASLEDFAARIAALGDAASAITFSAGFGRRLDYYSGYVFEIHHQNGSSTLPLVGGGRYDGLLKALGASGDIGAVGFSIWMERVRTAAGGAE